MKTARMAAVSAVLVLASVALAKGDFLERRADIVRLLQVGRSGLTAAMDQAEALNADMKFKPLPVVTASPYESKDPSHPGLFSIYLHRVACDAGVRAVDEGPEFAELRGKIERVAVFSIEPPVQLESLMAEAAFEFEEAHADVNELDVLSFCLQLCERGGDRWDMNTVLALFVDCRLAGRSTGQVVSFAKSMRMNLQGNRDFYKQPGAWSSFDLRARKAASATTPK